MYKRRIGNDIPIKWNIKQYGEEYTIPEGNNDVYLLDNTGSSVPITYTISGSAISFTFLGKNQKRTGAYTLKYVHNDGIDGMVTIDKVRFLELVDHNYQAEDVQTLAEMDEIVVESDIELPSNGYSAYDLAVQHGYVGTEAQWVESLKKPATDAAATANSAAAAANSAAAEANSAAESASTAANAASTQASAASVAAQSANTAATAANNAASVANAAADRLDVDLSGKVDKVSGKGLISNSFINSLDATPYAHTISVPVKVNNLFLNNGNDDAINVKETLSSKVDKVEGQGLISTNITNKLTAMGNYLVPTAKIVTPDIVVNERNLDNYLNDKVDKDNGKGLISTAVADEMLLLEKVVPPTIIRDPDNGITMIPNENKKYVQFSHGIYVNEEIHVGGKKLVFNSDGSVTWTNE